MDQANQIIALLTLAVPLIVVAAIVAARTRKVKRAMLLLAFAPAGLMAGVIVLGTVFGSSSPGSAFYKLAFAVMLIGTIAIIPWMVVCGIGFAIGYAIRRRNPPPLAAPDLMTLRGQVDPPTLSRPAPAVIPVDTSGPCHSQLSPDGSIRIDIQPVEWASSQWASTPRVVQVEGERTLCNMLGTDWDAHISFPRERYVWLGLRRYCAPGYLFADFDLDADRYRIALTSLDEADEEGPIRDVSDRLEAWWQKATAIAAARVTEESPVVAAPGPFAAWRTALVILLGSIVAIAGLTWLSLKTGIDPSSVRAIPHIPRFPH